ncbi:MAG: hypothetical protein AAFW98_17705, partial [Pseudomonadota bacterium]
MKTSLSAAVLAASLAFCVGAGPANALEERQFNVVGTWGQLAHWREREDAFWNETLPEVSGGKLTANAKPLTELGLDGRKVMRDVRAGAFDFANGVFLYISGDSPVIEGADLAGMVPDVETFRKVMDAYLPARPSIKHQDLGAVLLVEFLIQHRQVSVHHLAEGFNVRNHAGK